MGIGTIVSTRPRSAQGRSAAAKVDYLFETSSGRSVATLTVGPYRNASMYRDRVEEWSLRAFGVAWFYDIVLLVLPSSDEEEIYRQRVQQLDREISERNAQYPHVPRVKVASVFVEPFGPEYAAAGDLAP
jgi:hypothetical protein